MTVPTFYNLDNGLGSADKPTSPYIVMTNQISPRFIFEDSGSSGGGGSPPTSGQLWPRRA